MVSIKLGGDATGNAGSKRTLNYIANRLNQDSAWDVDEFKDVLGTANALATVTVNANDSFRTRN